MRAEVESFEQILKISKERVDNKKEIKPPYLDEADPFYNSELAIIIETWGALFIDKQFIKEKTAKQAAIKYIKSKYPNYAGVTHGGSGALGTGGSISPSG